MTSAPTSVADAERLVESARDDLAETIDQLKGNLRPAHLKKEAADAVRARTPDWVAASVQFLISPAGIALIAAGAASVVSTEWARRRRRKAYR